MNRFFIALGRVYVVARLQHKAHLRVSTSLLPWDDPTDST